jgi:KDO2-lipid IV(A) lauroyltransferase
MITSPAVIRGATALLRVAPPGLVRGMAAMSGTFAYYAMGERRRIVRDNLTRIAPNASGRFRNRLARRTFRNLAAASVDLFRLPHVSRDDLLGMVACVGRENFDNALALGKGVVIATAHLGPYELAGAWLAAVGFPVHAMVEDLAPDVLAALATYRTATGMQTISMKQGARGVLRLLAQNQAVMLVADRAVEGTKGVVKLPFGGGVRPVPTGPASFAAATGAPVVVGMVSLNPTAPPRYLVQIEPPVFATGRSEEDRLRLTRYITDRLAAAVRKHPDEWYVFQPQWESSDRD